MTPPKIMLILTENWTIVHKQDLRKLVDWAVIAEQAGIDGVMLSEHVLLGPSAGANGVMSNPRAYALPGNQDPATPWPSSPLVMAAIAARTSKIRIFGGAIIAPLRHPILTAHQLATLDLLSEGRLIVQPTVSWHKDEYDALGIPFNKRGKMLDEILQIWKLLWTETPASFQGEYFQFENVYMEPKPFREGGPTLWFGGQRLHAAIVRRLVAYGDGFHPLGPPPPDELEVLEAELSKVGRSFEQLEKVGGIRATFPDDNSPASLEVALESIPPQLEQGYTTICVKPNQFIDAADDFEDFCAQLVDGFSRLVV